MSKPYNRQTVRVRFKENYLETKAGSRLRALGVHPAVNTMVSVQTEDGFNTVVDRHDLLENEALIALYAGQVPVVDAVQEVEKPTVELVPDELE